ncbi:hypothetical protein ACJJIF_06230 [Microbulbifer sp. SSSA002]|uniref:hypothetical protein n=1 Tax=Microbulbifer sp. SSSA002 TaxID=3243376 RepID=UPI00403931FE
MLNFSGKDEKARLVMLHYAGEFNNQTVLEILSKPRGVFNKEEAIILSRFFWEMLDATALDREEGKIVLGEANLQHWAERIMHIIGGYLNSNGYQQEWDTVCDEA